MGLYSVADSPAAAIAALARRLLPRAQPQLKAALAYLADRVGAAPEEHLLYPAFAGWLRAAERGPAGWFVAEAAGLAAATALLLGESLKLEAPPDDDGHFHLYGLRARLELGRGSPSARLEAGACGLTLRGAGWRRFIPRELLLDALASPSPGRHGPRLVEYSAFRLRWDPLVALGTGLCLCEPLVLKVEGFPNAHLSDADAEHLASRLREAFASVASFPRPRCLIPSAGPCRGQASLPGAACVDPDASIESLAAGLAQPA